MPPIPQSDPEFGALLHSRRWSMRGSMLLAFCILGLIGIAAFWTFGRLPLLDVVIIQAALVGAVVGTAWKIARDIRTVAFYENGAVQFRPRRPATRLSYAHVQSVRYRLVRRYIRGMHLGTQAILTLTPTQRFGADLIRLSFAHGEHSEAGGLLLARPGAGPDPMDRVMQIVSMKVAERLGREIAAGRLVPWTNRATIAPQGLVVHRRFGAPLSIPWAQIARVGMGPDGFQICRAGERVPTVILSPGAENFHAGLFLFRDLREHHAQAGEHAAAA